MSLQDFKNQCRETFKESIVEGAIRSRFSTGSYDVDRALGLMARGRFHLWVGRESSCKTSLSTHTARQVNLINWDTGEYDPTLTNPSPVMFVDLEGTFDMSWAEKIGVPRTSWDEYNYHVQPTSGEIAANIVLGGIESKAFGLIIVDSNEAFVSMKTIEKATEQDVMCDRSKILSRMYRVGQSNLINAIDKERPWRTPTVICLNQLRDNIGSMYGGDTIPGGRAQLQYSSTILHFNAPLVKDDSLKSYGIGEFKGVTKKNKTAPPKKNFLFRMALLDLTDDEGNGLSAGQIDNAGSILSDIKTLDLMKKVDKGYEIFGETYRVQSDFKNAMRNDPEALRVVWNKLLEIHLT